MQERRLMPWEQSQEIILQQVQDASAELTAAREKLLAHINKRHPGQVLEGCHECPKIKVEILEAEAEYSTRKSWLKN